jgi:small nuclear ribonucleoprotein (snRNP)-like protein
MRKFILLCLFLVVAAGAYAQVSDLVLSGIVNRNVVVEQADGSVVSGQLSSYDATSVVIIKEGGELVEIARKDVKSIKVATSAAPAAAAPAAAAPAAAAPAAQTGDRPVPPDLAAVKGKSRAERQTAYVGQYQLLVDPLIVALKMGEGGRFYPLAQWEPVLRDVPSAYQLFQSYNNRRLTSTIFLIGGAVLLVPGAIMSITGPFLVGIILDLGALVLDVVSLIVQPNKNDLQKIADAYNANTRKALDLSYASPPEGSATAMSLAPPSFSVTLLSLRL